MTTNQITLFLSPQRAQEAATTAYRSDRNIKDFLILRGTAKWEDGTRDQGFKVRLTHKSGEVSFL